MRESYSINIDIMDTKEFPLYDILYCDPPWEQRMVKFFQTIMKKQTGKSVDNNIDSIILQLARLSSIHKPVFIEYSIKGTDRVIKLMTHLGHNHNNTFELLQENGKPYNLIVFNSNIILPEKLKGFAIIKLIINTLKPKIVFDPFAGIGQTAKTVLNCSHKTNYIGHELNPARYSRLKKVIDEIL